MQIAACLDAIRRGRVASVAHWTCAQTHIAEDVAWPANRVGKTPA